MESQELIQSMVTELRRGTLTLVVLSQCNKPQYGYSLLQSLEEKGVVIDASTLYPMLRRLDKQNILKSEWDTQETRPRKYYVLSDLGQTVYEGLIKEWKKLNNELKFLEEEI
ncbi:PadR family transcriptional regulator (plasmid) [Erysipelothrix larvae]|uniref:PadR family transcriptional regulator n=1 Tax=Erysipelothrix larvae TaxID=1514105 RepID=A0A0X8H280_9FIRM|nr:PadR family transcriptional regulator [Erysipelothrix larvae]AMC93770.1 PadR family transcriptional regulator [Erysipelothrix larvae]AMC94686.1 PadR family transcriptional regulator [Erysipelothrix larvae]